MFFSGTAARYSREKLNESGDYEILNKLRNHLVQYKMFFSRIVIGNDHLIDLTMQRLGNEKNSNYVQQQLTWKKKTREFYPVCNLILLCFFSFFFFFFLERKCCSLSDLKYEQLNPVWLVQLQCHNPRTEHHILADVKS